MKTITLSQGKVTIVDDEDYEYLSQWKWYYSSWGYAVSHLGKDRPPVYMARLIMQPVDKEEVDHISRDKLDNRRSNLRICNSTENKRNKGAQSNNKLGVKGVSWNKQRKRYMAQICINKKSFNLGGYKTIEEAAKVYNETALKHFGEFAKVNL